MHCGSCGTNLPPGAAVCPVCGVPTPYNVSQVLGSGAPYVPPQSSNDPTYISSPYSSTPSPPVPPTNYGSQTYNPSQQNPYATPPTNPYAPPPVNPYGAPVPQDPYGVPVQPYPGSFPLPVPPKRRSRVGLIIGIVVLVFVVLGLVARYVVTNAMAPSGLQIDPSAAMILTNLQMASAIDSTTAMPTTLTTTFVVKQTIYVTFGVNAGAGSGYAVAKWYRDGKFAFANNVLPIPSNLAYAAFFAYFNIPTNGAVELYWCTQSNCIDAKLAGFTTFTVTAASSPTANHPAVTLIDMDRRGHHID